MARIDNYNPDEVVDDRPQGEFELLHDGIYVSHIIETDLVPTKTPGGQVLEVTEEILEGPHAGRRVWDHLNIVNRSAQAQEIGQRQLKRLCGAVGHVGVLTDSEQLHFKPHRIRVGHEAEEGFKPKNTVKAYMPMVANQPTGGYTRRPVDPGPQQAERQPAQAAAGGGSRPWGNR